MTLESNEKNIAPENNINSPEEKIEAEEQVAFGEIAPIDRLQNQIRLAKDMYEQVNGPIDHDRFHNDIDFRNSIMNFWSGEGESSYSAAYRRLENSDWFKYHPELNGDIFKIEIKHILQFIESEKDSNK